MGESAMNEFMPIILEMMKNPPDANESIPVVNHFSTAIAVTMPFLVLSVVAVGLRLYTRLHLVREPGWDDVFVAIAVILNLVGQTTFLGGVKAGIGQHLIYILGRLPNAMKWFYVANAAYTSTTVCIKLSLILQYLRLFREGYRRTITLIVLAVVVLWGGTFSFMAWFPCFPVSGFWNKTKAPPATCYAFGYRTTHEARNTLFAFAGSNMSLDILVFLIPLTEYFQPNLKRKQVLAMTGLFGVGLIVILMAVLRLWSGLKYNNRGIIMYDYTFWLPEVLVFSCLEIDFAIICASMPIFWPSVVAAWNQIYVTKEVIVTVEHRDDDNKGDLEMARTSSRRSNESTEGLVTENSTEGRSFFIEDLPTLRIVQIQPLEETVRMSWGGTALKK
ncbi:hypothetical protein DPSP01_005191 [Paraphaeosphaeria sporulosa]|uniref:Rhodopsin domain-containing protein n=1 Tax=Paraphaeosphaeria sporulosa TaxID=1460663 RepID=A0A177BWI6_9PLEO|nr:uncharacterized protein CC84DRAFT_1156871 [Paraphaeosphaeria sporulosa]OAF99772.1 hypothetical protein CC84DRAFT_1156871 [Paraphaeosphaeria sporulosa]